MMCDASRMGGVVSLQQHAQDAGSKQGGGATRLRDAVIFSHDLPVRMVELHHGSGLCVLADVAHQAGGAVAGPRADTGEPRQTGSLLIVDAASDKLHVVWEVELPGLPDVHGRDQHAGTSSAPVSLASPVFPCFPDRHSSPEGPDACYSPSDPHTEPQTPKLGSGAAMQQAGAAHGAADCDGWRLRCDVELTDGLSLFLCWCSAGAVTSPTTAPSAKDAQPVSWQAVVRGLRAVQLSPCSPCDEGARAPCFTASGAVPAHDYVRGSSAWGIRSMAPASDVARAREGGDMLRLIVQLHAVYHKDASFESTGAQGCSGGQGQGRTPAPGRAGPAALPAPPSLAVQALAASLSPRILIVHGFFDPEMCAALIRLAEPRLHRSRVSSGALTLNRTSEGTFFTGAAAQDPLVQQVAARMAALVVSPAVGGGRRRLLPSEALQVVRYREGELYADHYDNKAGGEVTRHATVLLYLNTCPAGGCTSFPRAAAPPTEADVPLGCSLDHVAQLSQDLYADSTAPRPGVRIMPVAGRAVVFWSALPDGREDLHSLHAAEAVTSGSKWIASRWFKEVG